MEGVMGFGDEDEDMEDMEAMESELQVMTFMEQCEQWTKGPWLLRVYKGLYYPVMWGYKDPYKTTRIMESKRFIFVAHVSIFTLIWRL